MASREIFWNIPIGPFILYPLAVFVIGILCYSIYRRGRLWLKGKGKTTKYNWGKKITDFVGVALLDGFLHKRSFQDYYPAVMHFFIFWGCVALLTTTALDVIDHYFTGPFLQVHFLQGWFYLAVKAFANFLGLAALLGVLIAAFRRYVQRPERLDNKPEDLVALILIFVVVLTGFVLEGLRISHEEIIKHPEWAVWSFGGYLFAVLFSGLSESTKTFWHSLTWWFHTLLVLGSFAYVSLSFTKLGHVLIGPINAFFRPLKPKGQLDLVDLEAAETFGVADIGDFSWKHLMDLDACTRCGRCQANCPAHITGKPLSPKKVVQDLKGLMIERLMTDTGNSGDASAGDPKKPAMVGEVITEDVIWSCTTCGACVVQCPVYIDQVGKIIEMRRNLVLEQVKIPETSESILRCVEARGHTCRGTTFDRLEWTKGLDVKLATDNKDAEILYWVGCTAALEERNMKVARALAVILKSAGVNFAILGANESCCGEPVRRMGNEYLYQLQAQKNVELLKGLGVRKIMASCPHCFNTIKNEYTQFGGHFEVLHHSELIASLIKEGRIKVKSAVDIKTVYHDSCYLGRWNDIYEAPRKVMKAVSKNPVEMKMKRKTGFCCGGGGGRFWMEERIGKRISEERTEQVIATGAGVVATACPYCLQMFEDAIKAKDAQESLHSRDIAELVAENLA